MVAVQYVCRTYFITGSVFSVLSKLAIYNKALYSTSKSLKLLPWVIIIIKFELSLPHMSACVVSAQ